MGSKDKTGKLFVACRDVFAELINGLVYQGEEILTEETILPGPTESVYPKQGTELASQFQDYSMYHMGGEQVRALYTLENQSSVDGCMPLRCAGYEGAAYRRQYGPGDGQGIYPVISVVLNWSGDPWEAATSIRELLGNPVPAAAEDYLDKNRIHVFDMRFLEKMVRERFEGDVRVVLDYLSDRESMLRRGQRLRNPEETMRMLHALTGDTRYLDNIEFMEGEGRGMCDLLDYMENKGMQKGMEKGIQKGMEKGIQVLIATYRELGVTYEAAAAGVKEKYDLNDTETRRDMELYW